MLLTALVLLAGLIPQAGARAEAPSPAVPPPAAAPEPPPRYDPAARAVSNWRTETGAHLTPRPLALAARISEEPPAYVARCVRLNNGWCIKSARWPGEVGADGEGHTAFATLADGADAAAGLLRRYYRDYGRRTALAIVRRWAPAECRVSPGAPGMARGTPAVPGALAPRGIGRTLRARYLAGHRPGGAPRRAAALRVQPWSPLALRAKRGGMRGGPRTRVASVSAPAPVPDIAVGIGAPAGGAGRPPGRAARGADDPAALLDHKGSPRVPSSERMVAESALLPAIAAGLPLMDLRDLRPPTPLCANDEARIRAYAARIGASVGRGADDDLDLFGPDGAPRPTLAPVMLAMSGVELGALRAGPELVAAAIARLAPPAGPTGRPRSAAEASPGESSPAEATSARAPP